MGEVAKGRREGSFSWAGAHPWARSRVKIGLLQGEAPALARTASALGSGALADLGRAGLWRCTPQFCWALRATAGVWLFTQVVGGPEMQRWAGWRPSLPERTGSGGNEPRAQQMHGEVPFPTPQCLWSWGLLTSSQNLALPEDSRALPLAPPWLGGTWNGNGALHREQMELAAAPVLGDGNGGLRQRRRAEVGWGAWGLKAEHSRQVRGG